MGALMQFARRPTGNERTPPRASYLNADLAVRDVSVVTLHFANAISVAVRTIAGGALTALIVSPSSEKPRDA